MVDVKTFSPLLKPFLSLGRRRPPTFQACTELWGEARILDGAPSLHEFENALYVPWSHGGPWGLFKEDRTVIQEGVDVRMPERVISGPEPKYPDEDPKDVDDIDFALYLGFINVHYGHFIINSVPRFWPLLDIDASMDPLLLCHTRGTTAEWAHYPFVGAMLAGLRLTPDKLHAPARATRIRRLLVAESSLCEQNCAYPIFRSLCKEIGREHWSRADENGDRRPLYLSKTRLTWGIARLAQEQDFEDTLRNAGIDIAYPETMTFAEQVGTLARRPTILATMGSSLHTSIFSAPGRRNIAVSLSPLVNSNYALIDRLNDNVSRFMVNGPGADLEWDDANAVNPQVDQPVLTCLQGNVSLHALRVEHNALTANLAMPMFNITPWQQLVPRRYRGFVMHRAAPVQPCTRPTTTMIHSLTSPRRVGTTASQAARKYLRPA